VLQYTRADIRREYATEKGCAATCTLACVHQMSMFDRFRGAQVPQSGATPRQDASVTDGASA
jgi:hypothetical protein